MEDVLAWVAEREAIERDRKTLKSQFDALEGLIAEVKARHAVNDVTPTSERSWREEAADRLHVVRAIANARHLSALDERVRTLEAEIQAAQDLLDAVITQRSKATRKQRRPEPQVHQDIANVCPRCGTRQRLFGDQRIARHEYQGKPCVGEGFKGVARVFVPPKDGLPPAFLKQTRKRRKGGVKAAAMQAAGGILNATDRRPNAPQVRTVVSGGLPEQGTRR